MKWLKAHRNQLLTIACTLAFLCFVFLYIINPLLRTFIQSNIWRILAAFSPIFIWVAAKKRRGPAPADVFVDNALKYATKDGNSHKFVRFVLTIPWYFWFFLGLLVCVLGGFSIVWLSSSSLPVGVVVGFAFTIMLIGIACILFAGISPSLGEKDN